MSLDVYLQGDLVNIECGCCGSKIETRETLFDYNITHNLGRMAREAGLYEALWSPEEIGAAKASDITEILSSGLAELKANPEKYKAFNPSNGWGRYEHLVEFVDQYHRACKKNPDAIIRVSR
jgi:hypothetical protein